jgi:hypothetical protein
MSAPKVHISTPWNINPLSPHLRGGDTWESSEMVMKNVKTECDPCRSVNPHHSRQTKNWSTFLGWPLDEREGLLRTQYILIRCYVTVLPTVENVLFWIVTGSAIFGNWKFCPVLKVS